MEPKAKLEGNFGSTPNFCLLNWYKYVLLNKLQKILFLKISFFTHLGWTKLSVGTGTLPKACVGAKKKLTQFYTNTLKFKHFYSTSRSQCPEPIENRTAPKHWLLKYRYGTGTGTVSDGNPAD